MEFAEDLEFVTLREIEVTRIAQIYVELIWSRSRIAFHADRSVGSSNVVAVEVKTGNDVEGFAAVSGGNDAELIVIEKMTKRIVFKIRLRVENQTHHKSMGLVRKRTALIQTSIGRIGQYQTLDVAGGCILLRRTVSGAAYIQIGSAPNERVLTTGADRAEFYLVMIKRSGERVCLGNYYMPFTIKVTKGL